MVIFVLFWLCFDCFWLFLTIGTLLVHCWYSVGRHVMIGTPMVIFAVLTVFWLSFDCFWLFLTIGTALVHCWYSLGRPVTTVRQWSWVLLTIGTVYHSSKTVKNSQKTVKQQKTDHWCTNRHMSTQSPPNTQSRANAATLRNLHYMCLGSGHSPSPVGRADCMCLHGRPCAWLPFAAACCYTLFYLLMMPASSLSTTVIKFSIFSDPTRKLSALPPELRRIR